MNAFCNTVFFGLKKFLELSRALFRSVILQPYSSQSMEKEKVKTALLLEIYLHFSVSQKVLKYGFLYHRFHLPKPH